MTDAVVCTSVLVLTLSVVPSIVDEAFSPVALMADVVFAFTSFVLAAEAFTVAFVALVACSVAFDTADVLAVILVAACVVDFNPRFTWATINNDVKLVRVRVKIFLVVVSIM